jgi:hydrogenase 3 maturation protease
MPFEEELLAFLKGNRRLLLVGVGNSDRKDDAAGIKVISRLRRKVPKAVELMNCGTIPENFSSGIKRLDPSHIIFFDTVEMEEEPGFFTFVDENTLVTQSVSTHKQSLKMLFNVLKDGIPNAQIRLVGIQPKITDFGTGLSAPVDRGLRTLTEIIINALKGISHEDH